MSRRPVRANSGPEHRDALDRELSLSIARFGRNAGACNNRRVRAADTGSRAPSAIARLLSVQPSTKCTAYRESTSRMDCHATSPNERPRRTDVLPLVAPARPFSIWIVKGGMLYIRADQRAGSRRTARGFLSLRTPPKSGWGLTYSSLQRRNYRDREPRWSYGGLWSFREMAYDETRSARGRRVEACMTR